MDLITGLISCRTTSDFRRVIETMCARLEFEHYCVAIGTTANETHDVAIHNIPPKWDPAGDETLRRRDPVCQMLYRTNPSPVAWGRYLYENTDTLDLYETYSALGMRSGFDVPIATTRTDRMVVSIISDQDLPKPTSFIDRLELFCTFAYCLSAYIQDIANAERFAQSLSREQQIILMRLIDGETIGDLKQSARDTNSEFNRKLVKICNLAAVDTPEAAAILFARTIAR